MNESLRLYLLGSQHSELDALNAFGITEEQLDAWLVESEIDQCDECGTWEDIDFLDERHDDWLCSACVSDRMSNEEEGIE